jgi:hypothetical protein
MVGLTVSGPRTARCQYDALWLQYGRHHPIIASEYFLEPIGSGAGLFPARRRTLMRGFAGDAFQVFGFI